MVVGECFEWVLVGMGMGKGAGVQAHLANHLPGVVDAIPLQLLSSRRTEARHLCASQTRARTSSTN